MVFDPNNLPPLPEAPIDPLEKILGLPGKGIGALKSGYKNAVPQPVQNVVNPILKGAYGAVEPLTSWLFNNVAESPFRATAYPINAGIQAIKNPYAPIKGLGQEAEDYAKAIITPNSVSYHDALDADPKTTDKLISFITGLPAEEISEPLKKIMRNDIGIVLNFAGDPLNKLHGGGLTEAGNIAEKAGVAESTAKGLTTGKNSLLTFGNKPLVPKFLDKAVGAGLGKVGGAVDNSKLLSAIKAGFTSKEPTVALENLKLQKLTNPNNEATINAILMQKADEAVIADSAKKLNITPEEMHQRIIDYIEPKGSQTWKGQYEKPPFQVQAEAGKLLTPQTKELAERHIADYETLSEADKSKATRSYYIEHNASPEFKDKLNQLFPKIDDSTRTRAEQALHDSVNGRGKNLGKYTVNEINNLAAEGRLGEIPGLGGLEQWKDFKDKVFDDNVARVHASRYLESVKVASQKDYMTTLAKTYGIPKGAMLKRAKSGELDPSKWIEVSDKNFITPENKSGILHFPPEVAKSIEKSKNLGSDSPWAKEIKNSAQELSNFSKKTYFGIFPASIMKIFLGNQALAYMSDLYSPGSQLKGLKMAANIRLNKLSDKILVNHPTLGPLTEKQVFDLAKQNRAYGMGLFRQELPKTADRAEKYLGSKKAQKVVDLMWQGHNFVEDSTRLGTYIETLKRGYDPFGGAKATRRALYDYSELGPWIKSVKSVTGAPFLTFQAKNVANMTKQWIKNPARTGLPLKIQNEADQDIQDQRKYWSPTKAEGSPLPVGNLLNKTLGTNLDPNLYLHLNSMWPANDVNRYTGSGRNLDEILNPTNTAKSIAKTAVGMVNPIPRIGLEALSNYNMNSGQPIERMPGQKEAFGPFILGKRYEQYPLSQIRPAQDLADALYGTKQTGGQKALRYLGSLGFRTANPEQEKLQSEMGDLSQFRGYHSAGEKNLPRYFGKRAVNLEKQGDTMGAQAARQNVPIAIQNEREAGQKLRDLFSKKSSTSDSYNKALDYYKSLKEKKNAIP